MRITIRAMILLVSCLAVTACGRSQNDDAAVSEDVPEIVKAGCDVAASRQIALSGKESHDVLEARAFGPTCNESAIAISGYTGETRKIMFVQATPTPYLRELQSLLEEPAITTDTPLTPELMARALNGMLERIEIQDTSSAPDWGNGQAFENPGEGAFQSTPFPREEYLRIRAEKLPMFCIPTDVERASCWAKAKDRDYAFLFYKIGR